MNENASTASRVPAEAPFVVRAQWLHDHARRGGVGWSRAQLAVLGIEWPPSKGWLRRLVGRGITQAQREAFEQHGKL